MDLAEPRHAVELLQQVLALGVAQERQSARDVIGEAAGFGDAGGGGGKLVGEVGRAGDDLLEERDHVLAERFDLGRDFGLDIGQALHLGAQEGLGGGELVSAHARDALAEEQQVVLRDLDGLVHDAHRADSIEVLGARAIPRVDPVAKRRRGSDSRRATAPARATSGGPTVIGRSEPG